MNDISGFSLIEFIVEFMVCFSPFSWLILAFILFVGANVLLLSIPENTLEFLYMLQENWPQ